MPWLLSLLTWLGSFFRHAAPPLTPFSPLPAPPPLPEPSPPPAPAPMPVPVTVPLPAPISVPAAGTPTSRIAAGTAALGLLVGIVIPFEGYEPKVAPDPIGVPTYCYGETLNLPPVGTVFSKAECRAKLEARLPQYEKGMAKCITYPELVGDHAWIAFISFTYNVGVGAFCGSTLVKKLNAGDLKGACNELPRWNKAGGKVLPGLVKRRADEQKLCLEDT